jgi:hypothetical protein
MQMSKQSTLKASKNVLICREGARGLVLSCVANTFLFRIRIIRDSILFQIAWLQMFTSNFVRLSNKMTLRKLQSFLTILDTTHKRLR